MTVVVSPFMAERPQLISLILVVWLAATAHGALTRHRLPWWTLAVSYIWTNLHGMWILIPAAMLVVAVGLFADRRPGWRPVAVRAVAIAAGSFALAALTPVGPRLAYWPFVVRDAASDVSEWRPTTIEGVYGFAFVAVLAIWVYAIARDRERAPRSEILWMLVTFAFSLMAARNVAPAALLMAPFVVTALQRCYGARLATLPDLRVPSALLPATVAVAALLTIVRVASVEPIADGVPLRIVAELKDRPGTVRVFNSYSVGGVLTGLGAPQVSVAIDGRTDNYSAAFVHEHFLATTQLFHWRRLIARLHPDVVVTGQGGQLYDELTRIGWTTTMVDGDFALLDPPDRP